MVSTQDFTPYQPSIYDDIHHKLIEKKVETSLLPRDFRQENSQNRTRSAFHESLALIIKSEVSCFQQNLLYKLLTDKTILFLTRKV